MKTQKRCHYFTFRNVFGDIEYVAYEQLSLCEKAHHVSKAKDKSDVGVMIAPEYYIDGSGEGVTVVVDIDGEQRVYEFDPDYDIDGTAEIIDTYIQMYICDDDGNYSDLTLEDVVVPAWFIFVLDDLTAIKQEKLRTQEND